MFRPLVLRCATTQSIPAITWVTSTAPSTEPALMFTMRAPGAIPAYPVAVGIGVVATVPSGFRRQAPLTLTPGS